jgi:hypothetical protein
MHQQAPLDIIEQICIKYITIEPISMYCPLPLLWVNPSKSEYYMKCFPIMMKYQVQKCIPGGAFFLAIQFHDENYDFVRYLIKQKSILESVSNLYRDDECIANDLETFRKCLKYFMDYDLENISDFGYDFLYAAVHYGYEQVVKDLLTYKEIDITRNDNEIYKATTKLPFKKISMLFTPIGEEPKWRMIIPSETYNCHTIGDVYEVSSDDEYHEEEEKNKRKYSSSDEEFIVQKKRE